MWDTITKRKLVTFKSLNKCVKFKVKGKLVNLKEEKNLTTRLLVISRTRTGIDISDLFSKHEFSVVPHPLFDQEGRMLKCDDKSAFLHCIEEMLSSDDNVNEQQSLIRNCIAIDAMGFVNQLKMIGLVKLEELVEQFVKRVEKEVRNKDYVILVFDSYDLTLSVLNMQHGRQGIRFKFSIN